MNVTLIPVLDDNYAYLLEGQDGAVGVVDPGEAGPVIEALEKRALKLGTIFCTHHHGDHVAGVSELKSRYGAEVIGPEKDQPRIQGLDVLVGDGDVLDFGGEEFRCIETPGHTLNHICYYFPEIGVLFSGDTLFSMGCGRLFEGTPAQMWSSLQKLMALPDETLIYCGHEYTQGGAEFCLSIEPDNPDLQRRYEAAKEMRSRGEPTLPVSLETEKKTNVFLRARSVDAFAEVRLKKDSF